MRNGKLTVVVSAGQSRNPEKRELEKEVGESVQQLDGVGLLQVPHLYDLAPGGESFAALKSVSGDIVLLSWLYDRAAHWVLDRNGVRGQVGEVELREPEEDDESDTDGDSQDVDEPRVIDDQPRPERRIYCLDFRVSQTASDFVDEIERIATLTGSEHETGLQAKTGANVAETESANNRAPDSTPLTLDMLQRFEAPTNDTYVGNSTEPSDAATLFGEASVVSIDEHPGRRWYPVIDFSRCTNCMECIDFCLFGVYGVDSLETIVVEQADNCRKGCPACSRVCPQNAIIFPQHKTPAIAGAPVDTGGLKIDLSKLFGAPESDEDAAQVAARERDEQLILAGREAVGTGSVIDQRLAGKKAQQADDLDGLLDQLDSMDL